MFKDEEIRGKHAKHAKKTTNDEPSVEKVKPANDASKEAAPADEQKTVKIDTVKKESVATAAQTKGETPATHVTPPVEPLDVPAVPAVSAVKPAVPVVPSAVATPVANGETPGWTPIDYENLKKASTTRKIVGITVGVVVALVAAAYIGGAVFFMSHFFPGTSINGSDISMRSQEDVAQMIDEMAADYSVEVSGSGMDFTVSSQDMGIQVDGSKIASEALAETSPWTWPMQVNESHDITERLVTEYNAGGLEEAVTSQVDAWNEEATDPVNASLTYNEEANAYEVVPEQPGTKFDTQKVLEVVDAAVMDMEPTAELSDDQLLVPSILSDNEDLLAAQETANGYVQADLHLILGESSEVAEINADQISQWVTFGDDMSVSFDDEAMDGWLTELGNSFDTVGTERTYTRPNGKTVTVDGGTYGWEVDTAGMVDLVHQEIMNGTQGEISVPWIAGAAFYNGPGAVDWSDYIDVDLSEQHVYYITGEGEVTWESDCITGMPDGKHDTPTGIWTLFSMESPATLKGEILAATGAPEYETQVQYWMPFTYSGCGLHDATWQPAFGGSMYSQGYGSHGCVNLSYDAAASLYDIAVVGIPVIVHW